MSLIHSIYQYQKFYDDESSYDEVEVKKVEPKVKKDNEVQVEVSKEEVVDEKVITAEKSDEKVINTKSDEKSKEVKSPQNPERYEKIISKPVVVYRPVNVKPNESHSSYKRDSGYVKDFSDVHYNDREYRDRDREDPYRPRSDSKKIVHHSSKSSTPKSSKSRSSDIKSSTKHTFKESPKKSSKRDDSVTHRSKAIDPTKRNTKKIELIFE